MSERQAKAPTMSALLPSRLVPEDMLSEWQGPNLPNTKNYAPPPDSMRGRMGDVLMQGIAALGGFTGLPMGGEGDRAALLGELLAAGMPLVGGIKALRGIKAFHGSPHDFDQFSLSKIGTGEGAQAYGHGLYFAENADVADDYRKTLSHRDHAGYSTSHLNAQNVVQRFNGDGEYAAQVLRENIAQADPKDPNLKRLQDTLSMIETGAYAKPLPRLGKTYEVSIDADPEDFLDWDAPLSQQSEKVRGALDRAGFTPKKWDQPHAYQVTKDGEFIGAKSGDWVTVNRDETGAIQSWGGMVFGSQGKAEANVAARSAITPKDSLRLKGEYAYRDLDQPTKQNASELLRQQGIAGIKYLDGASRMPKFDEALDIREYGGGYMLTGKHASNEFFKTKQEAISALQKLYPQSRNYVVFDDTKISIVRKFGIAAALSAGAINELEARQMQAQGYQ